MSAVFYFNNQLVSKYISQSIIPCDVLWYNNFAMKIGYARVSTWDQNLSDQISALEEYGCEKIFQTRKTLTQRDKMLEFAREGDVIVVYKLDRLSRDTRDHYGVIDHMDQSKVDLVSLTQQIDTKTPMGRFFFGLMALMSELERDQISERTKFALGQRRRDGIRLGRPAGLTPAKQKQAKILLELHRDPKVTVSYICEHHNVTKATLYRRIDWATREEFKEEYLGKNIAFEFYTGIKWVRKSAKPVTLELVADFEWRNFKNIRVIR